MTQNQLMTAGVIGFAAFALIYITRKPNKGPVASQPGQQQRDRGLADWFASLNTNEAQFADAQIYNFGGFI